MKILKTKFKGLLILKLKILSSIKGEIYVLLTIKRNLIKNLFLNIALFQKKMF